MLNLPELDLSLTLWEGGFEYETATWLRWCRSNGELIPTGAEAAQREKARAEQEQARAEREQARAEQEQARAERLAAKLRELGIDPEA